MSKKNIISISILGLSFMISLVLFLSNDNRYSRLSFKFYHELENKIVVEDRFVILKGNKEEKAQLVVDELFLGPMSVFNHKIVPFDMKYNLFYINNKTIYMDLPLIFVTGFNETEYSLEDAINLIKENLINNIGGVKSVIITIDGQTLGAGPSKNTLPQVD